MSKQIRVISDSDWEVLKRLVAANQNLPQSSQRPLTNNQFRDGDDSMAPEVYIALPPDDGIPGLENIALGTGSSSLGTSSNNPVGEGDKPGSAICSIYKIIDGVLIPLPGLIRRVYNLSETAIGNNWITIFRDKGGAWLAGIGGGGCDAQNAILQTTVMGKPTGGTFSLDLTVNLVTQTLTFNFNSLISQSQTLFESHSQVGVGQVNVTGGTFPSATQQVEFIGSLAHKDIAIPVFNWGSLTGGTGVAIIGSTVQKGHT